MLSASSSSSSSSPPRQRVAAHGELLNHLNHRARALEPAAHVEETPAVAVRHVLGDHAVERGQVLNEPVQEPQRIVGLVPPRELPRLADLGEVAQDAERVVGQPLAHGLGVALHVAEHRREAVLALGVEQDRPELFLHGFAAFLHRAAAAPRRQVLLRHQHRDDALGRHEHARRAHLTAQADDEAAQQAHGAFRTLRIAAEPEQVVGRAARQIAAAAAQTLTRLTLREQAELLDGLIREHPGVLADVAELEPRRVRVDAVGDAREAARHDLVALARRRDVDAQQHRRRA